MPCLDSACYRRYGLQKFVRSPETLSRIFLQEYLNENDDRLWNIFESIKRQGRVLMLIHHLGRRTLEHHMAGHHLPEHPALRHTPDGALHLNPRPRSALLLLRPLSVGRFASLRFRPKNMAHHIFQLETELQNIPEAAPSSLSFSVSEKLARYGSSALSGVEHLRLVVGKDSLADALLRHFGSLKALSRASFKELRQFLPKSKAEAVMAALSISNVADAEHALSAPLTNAETIYRANLDMKGFHQEVVRVVLLDAQHRCITRVDIARGTVNESLAVPREIFRPAII